MKKIMLSLLCAGIAASASAQKNSVLLFGDLSGNTNSSSVSGGSSTSTSTFRIMPAVGYQVNDNWTFGVELEARYTDFAPVAPSTTKSSNMEIGGGLFARRTWNIGSMFYFFTQADVAYLAGSSSVGGTTVPNSQTGTLHVGITPAFGVNIKNGWALNFHFGNLGVDYMSTSSTPTAHNTNFNYSIFSGLGFGVQKSFVKHVKPAKKHSDAEANEAGE